MDFIGNFINGVIDFARTQYVNYGYWIVLIGSLIKNTVPINLPFPIPASTILVLGAVYSAGGKLNIILVLLCAIAGLFTGMVSNYWLGRFGLYKYARKSKFFGPAIAQYDKQIEEVLSFLNRRGGFAFIIGYFIGAFRLIMAILVGGMGMRFGVYALWNIIAATIWVLLFGLGGYILGESLKDQETVVFFAALGISVVFIGIGMAIHKWDSDRAKKNAALVEESSTDK